MKLPKKYDFKEAEKKWLKYWEKEKVYKFEAKKGKNVYAIDTPPPTVSGKMHIGHAFSYSQEDFMARYHRMNGCVFYPFGTDDNGLPTERLVEKLKKVKSQDMSRKDFIALCLKTIKEIKEDFIFDWQRLGVSCDYDIYYSTIDATTQKVSQKAFLELFKRGEAYRKEFPTIWCPECQTAIAQAELEDKESGSLFTTVKFTAEGKDLLIATTRPELLGACVCIFVHPEDKRYKSLVGKKAQVPLFNHEVPILTDESADPEKGTGVLMVCSYGDKYDADAIQRFKLKSKTVLNQDGTLNIEPYKGMKIKEARKNILANLKEKDLIVEQKSINHTVNVHDKCGTHIEFLETEQWFINVLKHRKKLIQLGEKINWYPSFMFKRYKNWVEGLDWDWSISRDRHFGIPIPVWYCKECNEVIVPTEKELPVDPLQIEKKCSKCGKNAQPETKVLDTWATSSLTPQLASNLVKGNVKIPFTLRPQAHDIIRTWAFYTITRSYLHENEIPWKDIAISGFVTLKGQKMSKSKGNVINPVASMDQFGVDALRFWAASSKLGEDLDYQEKDLVTGQKTVTKLWNASKFAIMQLEDYKVKKEKLEGFDAWMISKLQKTSKVCTDSFEVYDYAKCKSETEYFFWHTFCDNYLEIVKDRLYNPDKREGSESAKYTLYTSLFSILKMFAPIMPYITEEIYQMYFKANEKDKSIHISAWPKYDSKLVNEKLEKVGNRLVEVISEVRKMKSSKSLSLKTPVKEIVLDMKEDEVKGFVDDLKAVTKAEKVSFGKELKIHL
tara:strand:- start:1491 stop:3836 length:2346 start_codon:yes stop_codon:yes gene_type:complete